MTFILKFLNGGWCNGNTPDFQSVEMGVRVPHRYHIKRGEPKLASFSLDYSRFSRSCAKASKYPMIRLTSVLTLNVCAASLARE